MTKPGNTNDMVILYAVIVYGLVMETSAKQQYSMYVWTDGYDVTIPGCDDISKFLVWDRSCKSHSWNTPDKLAWLAATCNRPGREITDVYISGFHALLRTSCGSKDITLVKETVRDLHTKVPGLKIYALFADSDEAVSERNHVPYVVDYNDNCAASAIERFDGIAINNEAYGTFKCDALTRRQNYLTALKEIKTLAAAQLTGTLLVHFSTGWHWGLCGDVPSPMEWNRETKTVDQHMIDIFDSIDVQVGYTTIGEVVNRATKAGYEYARSLGKAFYVNLYTNKVATCETSFFPDDRCDLSIRTEDGMFAVFDAIPGSANPDMIPNIHYFRGIYSSGGNGDWPIVKAQSTSKRTCKQRKKRDDV